MITRTKGRATIQTVAERARVSIKTVSRVFNGEPSVRRETREEVLRVARELDYSPNLAARRLAANRSFVIGLLYDNPQSDYVTSIQQGALQVCRRERYDLLIHPCSLDDPDLLDEVSRLLVSTVDGVLLTPPVSDFEPLLELLDERGMRYVRISQHETSSRGAACISVDDADAARAMTEYLIVLGHRRIGFVLGNMTHGSSHDRLRGYREALDAHSIPFDEALVAAGAYTFESGYEAGKKLLAARPGPTAVFASNDHMALGVMRVAREAGLRIPEDLSVCGVDDTPMASYTWPPLTTIRQPVHEVAAIATGVLLDELQGRPAATEERCLRSTLVHRQSTARPPEGRRQRARSHDEAVLVEQVER